MFAVLLLDAGRDTAVELAKTLCAALDRAFALDDVTVHSGVSIGIALFPDDGPDLSTLLGRADVAMYKAKASGRGHHVYRPGDNAADVARLQAMDPQCRALSSDQRVRHEEPKLPAALRRPPRSRRSPSSS